MARLFLKWLVKHILILGNTGKSFRSINYNGEFVVSYSMPDGSLPTPGGWNRFQLQVKNIESTVEDLKKSGVKFRNEIVTGVGGKQILLEDPAGNFIELFQQAS